MANLFSPRRNLLLAVLVLLGVAAGVLWVQRLPLLSWYYLNELAQADKESREIWVERVVSLDEAAVPGLLDQLGHEEPQVCANATVALTRLAQHWGVDDTRTIKLAQDLTKQFPSLLETGQEAVLEWHLSLLKGVPVDQGGEVVEQGGTLVNLATGRLESGVRLRALSLANLMLERDPSPECCSACQKLISKEIHAAELEHRLRAIHLTLHAHFREDAKMLSSIVPLLKDKEARVRRSAILALGNAKEIITEDELLPLLHDPDPEVRRLLEAALRSRGLQDSHLLLARLISAPQPQARLQVLDHLRYVQDLDPEVWLQRLTRDSSPAVRAAALREASWFPKVDLRNRMQDMMANDPSPTVQQLAKFYLNQVNN